MAEEPQDIHSWAVEYAKSGRSKCRISKATIPQGALRIGMEVDNPYREGSTMFVWSDADALFKSFRLGDAHKHRITSVDQLAGFEDLKAADKKKLQQLVDEGNDLREKLAEVDDAAIRLEHTKNGGVFWSVVQAGKTTRVRWGAIGEDGNVSEKVHKDEATATKFVAKKIAEKEKGGYRRAIKSEPNSSSDAAESETGDTGASNEANAEKATSSSSRRKRKAEPQTTIKQEGAGESDGLERLPAPSSDASGSADAEGALSWAVEYAKSGRSKCRISKATIPQGALRIGMEVDNPYREGSTMFVWSDADALFKSFRLGDAHKHRITSVDQLAGFEDLKAADKKKLQQLVDEGNDLREKLAEVDDAAIRLEHTKNGGVFWSVVQAGKTTRVRWGAIGEDGNVSEKVHKDEATATKFVAKKIAEKEKGGYERVSAAGSPSASTSSSSNAKAETQDGGGGESDDSDQPVAKRARKPRATSKAKKGAPKSKASSTSVRSKRKR